jgi:para-aminobenzoate synthetase/4-amino-4-deoxychorismate lyase
LTEGGRSTVFVKLDGRWWTPPIEAGVLPGVMRGVLIDELGAAERTITREELERAEALMVSNALRGGVGARLRT